MASRKNNWVQKDCIQHPRVQIFTDVSKRGNDTGFAFLASRRDVVVGEGGGALSDVSVFQAEVVAIQAALLWLISNPHKLKGTKVKLWTDSQSALQSVFSLKPTSMLVEETIKLMMSAKLICQVFGIFGCLFEPALLPPPLPRFRVPSFALLCLVFWPTLLPSFSPL